MIYGIGANDMPRGWASVNEYNKRVYQVWRHMIQRCYDEKFHEKYQTYKNCYCCERWLSLSNFVEDIVKIDNYEYWRDNPNQRISLDKDIKSNGQNKCYCLENCCFTTNKENCRQAVKTRDNTKISEIKKDKYKGKNNPRARKIVSVDPFTEQPVFTWQYKQQATKFYGISRDTLDYYLKGKAKKSHLYNGFLWYYLNEYEQLTK